MLHGDITGTLPPVLIHYRHRRLSFSAAPPLSNASATYQCIDNLNQILQTIEAIAIPHVNAYLAQHPAGGDPGYADLFEKPHSGNTILVRCSKINCPEPLGQGEFGGMKQRFSLTVS